MSEEMDQEAIAKIKDGESALEVIEGESNLEEVPLGEKTQRTVCTGTHLRKWAWPSKAHGGISSTTPVHSKEQGGRSRKFAMMSRKSDVGPICAASMGITHKNGRLK